MGKSGLDLNFTNHCHCAINISSTWQLHIRDPACFLEILQCDFSLWYVHAVQVVLYLTVRVLSTVSVYLYELPRTKLNTCNSRIIIACT